ncbi:MAG: FHA domain-containing protein [Verrucomicrobiales bacterium]|nr:FHA domain-containing protein [Verrucomicrobiales bacterium]
MALSIISLTESNGSSGPFVIPEGSGSYTVGRLAENDITIQHDSVSDLHARIEAVGRTGVDLIDCGSSNGTFVNGEKVERCPLKNGDEIRFASTGFKVLDMEESAEAGWQEEKKALVAEIESLKLQQQRDLVPDNGDPVRLSAELSKSREDLLEKDKLIATLQFELARRETSIGHLEEKVQVLARKKEEWQSGHATLEGELAQTNLVLEKSQAEAADLRARLDTLLERINLLSQQWREDWSYWSTFEDDGPPEDESDLAGVNRLNHLRRGIREQLDLIEPVWREYGNSVTDELKSRCEALRDRERDLKAEGEERSDELNRLKKEIIRVREDMDREVRRAQGLSRRNVEVAMPERYESMLIASDREQEIFLSLIEQIEFFERLIDGYRRSKKMKEAIYELEDFKKRLTGLLVANGVEPFEIEVGLFLTLKNRGEVKVFGKKGWGTREYIEQAFQPGKVTKVIRPGYRAGSGETAVVLRKVEVLIQEVEG